MLNRGVLGAIAPRKASVVAPSYQGLGDAVPSGWLAYYGFRAFDNASIGEDAVLLRRHVGTETEFFATEANGHVDLTAIEAFRAGDVLNVQQLNNQLGTGRTLGNAAAVIQPKFLASAINSLPGVDFTAASNQSLIAASDFGKTQPYSIVMLLQHEDSAGAQVVFSSSPDCAFYFHALGDDEVAYYDGGPSNPYGPCTDDVYHSVVWVMNGASSAIYVDGTSIATGTTAGILSTNDWALGRNIDFASQEFDGQVIELGIHGSALNSGQIAAIYANQSSCFGV